MPNQDAQKPPTSAESRQALGRVPSQGREFSMPTGVAPAQGGELKNIRRCLKRQKPDVAALCATLVAAGTTIWTVLDKAGQQGNYHAAAFVPVALAVAAAVVASLRFMKALEPDAHLNAAQEDADRLIALQADAQATVDRQMAEQLAQESRMRIAEASKSHAIDDENEPDKILSHKKA